jgi:hypothetical protein
VTDLTTGDSDDSNSDFSIPDPPCTSPPTAPSSPSPSNGAIDRALTTDLSWSGGTSTCPGLSATYDVYFGEDPTPDSGEFVGNSGTARSWSLPTLTPNTTYYWRVEARDQNGGTASPTWSFTTECDDIWLRLEFVNSSTITWAGTYPYDVSTTTILADFSCPSWTDGYCIAPSGNTCCVLNPFLDAGSSLRIGTAGFGGLRVGSPSQSIEIYVTGQFKNSNVDDRAYSIQYDESYYPGHGASTNCLDIHEVLPASSSSDYKWLYVRIPGGSDEFSIREITVFFPGWCNESKAGEQTFVSTNENLEARSP